MATTLDPFNGAFNGTEASRAILPNDTYSYCAIYSSRLTVAGERLYIDGGTLKLYPKNNFTTFFEINTRLIWIDLNEPFNYTNFTLGSTTKPPETYTEAGQAFVPKISDDKFYVFGGSYPMNNKNSEYFQEPPERNAGDLWSYSGSNRTWKLETPNPNVQRITAGSGTVDYLEEVIYYAQGNYIDAVVRDFPEGGKLPVDGLLSLHTTDPQPVWKNETIPGGASVLNGFLHYVPFGKRGVLLFFGGERLPIGTFNGASEMRNMSEIHIYDIQTASWHLQTASGTPSNNTSVPGSRRNGCSVMAPSPDNSSYNIHIYSGDQPGNTYDDVWALLIPSFIWVKMYEGSRGGTAHSCARAGPFMFMSGIVRSSLCENLFYIYDMVRLDWTSTQEFDPNARYEIPLKISDSIGGGASGGATRRRPLNGWSSNDVEAIFSTEPGKPGQQSGGGSPSRHEHSKLGPSKIAGLTVGIVLILAIVLGIYWFVCYKRRGYKRRGPDNFLSEQDSMQVSGLPHWNIEPGCLDELPEDHEREISNSGAVTLLLADRHPIEQVYPS